MNANELRIGNMVYKSLKSGQGRTVINPIGCQDIVRIFEDIGSFNYAPTPTSYKLNIDIPEWLLKAGDDIESGRLPRSIMEYIATPIYTQPFTLENGTEIELTNNDIDKIKKM